MILKKIRAKIAGNTLVTGVVLLGEMLHGWRKIANIHVKKAEEQNVIKVITS